MRAFKLILALLLLATLVSCDQSDKAHADGTDGTSTPATEESGMVVKNETAGTVLDYFAEIAFDSEFGTSPGRLCRWETQIVYKITGDATDSDRELIRQLCQRLNGIKGFPGIKEAGKSDTANFEVMFVSRDVIVEQFEHATDACTGMCEFSWAVDSFEIISARAAIDSAEAEERNSTICEEFLQALGLPNDSYSHRDSVFYQGKCLYNRPSELDYAMAELLYSPSLRCGMTKKEALASAVDLLQW